VTLTATRTTDRSFADFVHTELALPLGLIDTGVCRTSNLPLPEGYGRPNGTRGCACRHSTHRSSCSPVRVARPQPISRAGGTSAQPATRCCLILAVVSVPLPAPASLTATRSTAQAQAIVLSWSAAAGAHHYNVERMTGGGAFTQIGTPTQTTFTDTAVTTGVTYVYRVIAAAAAAGSESGSSNRDLATTMGFQSVVPGSPLDDLYFHELLTALNALHAANGWPLATWASILPPGVPAPGPGVVIRTAHLAALRDHMNLARQALGVASGSYADDPIVSAVTPIRAAHITAVQQRAQ
jgi:hypothetical protein